MGWFKIDDGFWSHPKTLQLTDGAVSLWVRAGSWSCQQLTDGMVPSYTLPMFGVDELNAVQLVEVGYWHEVDGGYEFHDWDEYQEASEVVKERRKKNAEKMRKWREAKAAKQEGDGGGDPVTLPVTNPVSNALPDPTRPDPTSSISNEIEESSLSDADASDRGELLPSQWRPNQTHIDKAKSLHLDVDREQSRFRDNAIRTQRRLKNWNTGFTNWLRKAAEFNTQRQGRPAPTSRPSPTDRIAAILAIGDEQEGIES